MDAGVDRVDIVEDIVGAAGLDQLHRGLAQEAGERFETQPAIGDQRRAEARLDLNDDLDQLTQALLRGGLADADRALDRVLAEPAVVARLIGWRGYGFGGK